MSLDFLPRLPSLRLHPVLWLVPAVDVLVSRFVNYSKIIKQFVELYERLFYFLLRTLPRGQIQVKLRDWKNVSKVLNCVGGILNIADLSATKV